jgi:agmatinase
LERDRIRQIRIPGGGIDDLSDKKRSAFEDPPSHDAAEARVVVVPVPHEASVSYGKGTAGGPQAILDASLQVELFDEQLRTEPIRVGIHTDDPLVTPDDGAVAEQAIAERVGGWMERGKWVAMLGGEHSITPGGVRAAASRHDGLVVVQLDAHADLRDEYESNPYSHACAVARCLEHAEVRAVGIRNYSTEEARRIAEGIPGYRIVHAWEMVGEDWHDAVLEGIDGRPVYLTIDVDYFDPAVIPSTGTPEPGGGTWYPTLRFLQALFGRANVVAADLVELAPTPALHHADFTVARLLYKLVGMRFLDRLDTVHPR